MLTRLASTILSIVTAAILVSLIHAWNNYDMWYGWNLTLVRIGLNWAMFLTLYVMGPIIATLNHKTVYVIRGPNRTTEVDADRLWNTIQERLKEENDDDIDKPDVETGSIKTGRRTDESVGKTGSDD